jgi:hypothetical protein
MTDSRPIFLVHQMQSGFLAPLECLKFFRGHKLLLVSALAPHLAFLAGLVYASVVYGVPYVQSFGQSALEGLPPLLVESVLGLALILLSLLLYTLLGVSLLNALLSPLFDVIAAKAYEETAGRPLPELGFSDFFRSFLSECSKSLIVITCLTVGFFLPMVTGGLLLTFLIAPALLFVSIWFFGWDNIDRTLSLMGWSLKARLLFGVRHALACFSLGLWVYVPFAGTLLSFTLAAAGAIVVAKVHRAEGKITP